MTIDRRTFFAATAGLALIPGAGVAQDNAADRRLRDDWAWWARYADDNARIRASQTPVGIVFMGDSITEGWRDKRPGFFAEGRVGRGISGQTTSQMLLRMMPDVVALKPRAVHIMAATNDVAGNTGPMTRAQTYDNLIAMTQIAQANRIAVLLAAVPPAAAFPWRPGLATIEPIAEINRWIRGYAARIGATHVDYTAALSDGRGGIRKELALDGVHPEAEGYAAMEKVIEPVLRRMKL